MSYSIDKIEGIGPAFKEKLAAAGIKTTEALLEKCCDKSGRKTTSEACGIQEAVLLKWANMADLMRLNGVASQFAELLKGAGVDTIKELRNRNAENLTTKMAEINAEKKLTRVVPSLDQVTDWIAEAKTLEPTITH